MKKLLTYPLRAVDGIAGKVAATAGALSFWQFPQYLAQYVQRLGGHVDEAQRHLDKYKDAAQQLGLSLEQYIAHLGVPANNEAAHKTADIVQWSVERLDYLRASLESLVNGNAFTRLPNFMYNADWDIAQEAFAYFTPGISFNAEGLIYAGVGLLAGAGMYKAGKAIAKLPFKTRKNSEQAISCQPS